MKQTNFEKIPKPQLAEGRKSPRRSRVPISPRKSMEKVGKLQTVATKVRINESANRMMADTDNHRTNKIRATRSKPDRGEGYPILTTSTQKMVLGRSKRTLGRSNPSLDSIGSDETSPRKTRESLPHNVPLPRAHSNESILDGVNSSRDAKRCSVDSRIREMEGPGRRTRGGGLRRDLIRRNLPKSDETLLASPKQERDVQGEEKVTHRGMGYYKKYFPQDY